jgi:tripartite-type tricarboxylate transporter receptor subunit TctC
VPTNIARAIQDAVAGTLHVSFESLGGLAGPIQSGSLRVLAVAAAKRLPDYPDLPTVVEAMPQVGTIEARGWIALAAPTGTPEAIVHKINADLRAILADADLQRRLATLGTYPRPLSTAETADFIRRERELWRPLVKQIDFTTQ